jgi:hypothetical protein
MSSRLGVLAAGLPVAGQTMLAIRAFAMTVWMFQGARILGECGGDRRAEGGLAGLRAQRGQVRWRRHGLAQLIVSHLGPQMASAFAILMLLSAFLIVIHLGSWWAWR